jgi:L-rhamnose 1-dehydrogenase
MSLLWPLLKGKTAAITGGTTGIGRGIVLSYLRQGCNVAVNHLGLPKDQKQKDSLIEEAAKIRAESKVAGELIEMAGDTTDPKTTTQLVAQAVDKWGKLDVFVANAGIFTPADFLE